MYLILSKSPWQGGMHGLGFVKFGAIGKKLLIFKVFFEFKKLKNYFYFDLRRIWRA